MWLPKSASQTKTHAKLPLLKSAYPPEANSQTGRSGRQRVSRGHGQEHSAAESGPHPASADHRGPERGRHPHRPRPDNRLGQRTGPGDAWRDGTGGAGPDGLRIPQAVHPHLPQQPRATARRLPDGSPARRRGVQRSRRRGHTPRRRPALGAPAPHARPYREGRIAGLPGHHHPGRDRALQRRGKVRARLRGKSRSRDNRAAGRHAVCQGEPRLPGAHRCQAGRPDRPLASRV